MFTRLAAAAFSSRPARIGAVAALAAAGIAGTMAASSASAGTTGAHCAGAPTVSRQFFGKAFDLYAGRQLPVYRYTLGN
jgi:hypothetical protein